MCVSPNVLKSGIAVPCRKCWQCRENKVSDWVGRCIAETQTARAASSITLTYGGGNHERAAVLTYSDVQKYFKLLRRHGYPLRYFAVGEYGSVKGRSHWHLVVFWQGDVPPHDAETRFIEPHWAHGWSYWERPSAASIRYVCKYIQKDIGKAERQGHLAMSKKPPLGADYFRDLARRYVRQGLAPQDAYYSFADVRGDDGKPVRFFLHGVSADKFCGEYLDAWEQANPGRHPPTSPLLEAYCDRMANYVPELQINRFRPGGSYPWIATPGNVPVHFSEPHNAFYCEPRSGGRLWWSFDFKGDRSWQRNVVGTEATAQRVGASTLARSRVESAGASNGTTDQRGPISRT